jgi:ribosomal protein S21
MLIVKVDSNIEKALKTLKSKVIRTKQMQRLVELKQFEKKSVKRRSQKQSAQYKQYLKTLGE